MAEKREGGMIDGEVIGRGTSAAKNGVNKLALVGFVGALIALALCSAPFALVAWWWGNEPPQTAPRPQVRPQGVCGAGETAVTWVDAQARRHVFCTPRAK